MVSIHLTMMFDFVYKIVIENKTVTLLCFIKSLCIFAKTLAMLPTKTIHTNSNAGLTELYHLLVDKPFSTKDTDVVSKNLFDWKKNGLLPVENAKQKANASREKLFFSFPELVWIKIITEMRDFGIGYAYIIKAKETLFAKLPVTAPIVLAKKQALKNKFAKSTELNATAQKIGLFDSDEKLIEFSQSVFKELNALQMLLMDVIGNRTTFNLYVLKNGDILPITGSVLQEDKKKEVEKLLNIIPSFKIPINPIIAKLVADEQYNSFVDATAILTKAEQELLVEIRKGNANEITLHFNNDSKQNFDISKKRKGIVNKDEVEKIVREVLSHPHQSISMTTNSNGKVNIEREKRKRIHEQ